MNGPVLRWALHLRRRVLDLQALNTRQALHVLRLETRVVELERLLQQARRDNELVALMARDRGLALGFLHDQHTIDRLEEA